MGLCALWRGHASILTVLLGAATNGVIEQACVCL